jgi:hypothetical protein
MEANFPNFVVKRVKSCMVWVGHLKPSQQSNVYKIKIKYALHRRPRVWVLDPPLIKRSDEEEIPHIYSDNSLCLYLPWNNEWNQNLLIAKTIVPWTSLYLYFYEVWLVTGGWLGGGLHPGKNDSEIEYL